MKSEVKFWTNLSVRAGVTSAVKQNLFCHHARGAAVRVKMFWLASFLLYCLLGVGAVLAAEQAPDGGGFFSGTAPLCHRYLAKADDFAEKCRSTARPFHRVFFPSGGGPGEQEGFAVYFDDKAEDSHFLLGCMVRPGNAFGFFGLYFTPITDIARVANKAPIGAIDANGDATLLVNGRYVPLIPVREFTTNRIPVRYKNYDSPHNCEVPRKGKFGYIGINASFDVDFSRFDKDGKIVRYVHRPGVVEYVEFFPSKTKDVIYSEFDSLIVSSGGNVFMEKGKLDKYCAQCPHCNVSAPDLTLYLCDAYSKGDK